MVRGSLCTFSATKFSVILRSSFSLSLSIKNKSIPLLCVIALSLLRADTVSLLSRLCHSRSFSSPGENVCCWADRLDLKKIFGLSKHKLTPTFITHVSKGYERLVSHLIQHQAAPHSKAVAPWHIRSEHPQTRAFFRPLSFSLSLTLKFSPHGKGFALSRGICIYDENNCLSEIRCFFWGKKGGLFLL